MKSLNHYIITRIATSTCNIKSEFPFKTTAVECGGRKWNISQITKNKQRLRDQLKVMSQF